MENEKSKNQKNDTIPPIFKKAIIVVAGTTLTLAFFYGLTFASSKILKNLDNMGV